MRFFEAVDTILPSKFCTKMGSHVRDAVDIETHY